MENLIIKHINKKYGKYDEKTNTIYPDINKLINRNKKSRKKFKLNGEITLPLFITCLNTKELPLTIILENQILPKLYTNDARPILFRARGNIIFKNCNIDTERLYLSDLTEYRTIRNLDNEERYLKFENCNFTGNDLLLGSNFKDIYFLNNKYNTNEDIFSIHAESRENFIFKNENIPDDKELKLHVESSCFAPNINIEDCSFNLNCIRNYRAIFEEEFRKHFVDINKINIKNSNIKGNIFETNAHETTIDNSKIIGKKYEIYSDETYINNSTLLIDDIDINSILSINIKNSFIKSNNSKIISDKYDHSKINMDVSAINSCNCDMETSTLTLDNSNITGNNTILYFHSTLLNNDSKIKSNDLLLETEKYLNIKNINKVEANTIFINGNIVSDEKGADINLIEPRNNLINTLKSISNKVNEKQSEEINNLNKNTTVKKLIKK